MITKAELLAAAQRESLLNTTVEKDYILGWMLYGIARHPRLSQWVFKGGTCLKKCFFETYRFSRDLDFTVPRAEALNAELIRSWLVEICEWIGVEAGIDFPLERIEVEPYENKQGSASFKATTYAIGPLKLPRNSLQALQLDITQNEVLVDPPDHRRVHHAYVDAIEPAPEVACYSINEILAEKTRAIYERFGRARDIYDVVNISRNFRRDIDASRALAILRTKFDFKKLPKPSVASIIDRVDEDALRAGWEQQLSQQLPVLPPLDATLADLPDALAWWIAPSVAAVSLPPAEIGRNEEVVLPQRFPSSPRSVRSSSRLGNRLGSTVANEPRASLDRIRYAARNRLLVELDYKGSSRVVEPYSLRFARTTGNTHLFVHERTRGGETKGETKRYDLGKIENARVTNLPFQPRWAIEL